MSRGGTRAGSGAKSKLKGRKVVSVSFDESTLTKLNYWCTRLGLSRSEAIRRVVAESRLPASRKSKQAKEGAHDAAESD